MPKPILSPTVLGVQPEDGSSQTTLLHALGPLPIPVGAPGVGLLLSMFTPALQALGKHLRMPSPRFIETAEQFAQLTTAFPAAPPPLQARALPASWRLGLSLAQEAPLELQMLFVGELVLATIDHRALPTSITRLQETLTHWQGKQQMPPWVTTALSDLLTRLVHRYDRAALAAPEVRRRLVNQRIALQLEHQVSFDDPSKIRMARKGSELTNEEVVIGLSALKVGIAQGDIKSLLVAAAFWIGILIDDMLDLPLDPRQTDALQLLLPEGLVDTDLSLALNELDKRRFPGTIPAEWRLVRHLPLLLTQGLFELRQASEGSRFWGDLLGQSQLHSWHPVPFVKECWQQRISIARLIQSRTAFLSAKLPALAAGFATMRFDHLPKSVQPYSTLPDETLWSAECTRAEQVGFGPLVPRIQRQAVGSRTTPEDKQILGALDYLGKSVEANRRWKKASLEQVVDFHNEFAIYISLAISFFLGLRRFHRFPLLASMLGLHHVTSIRHKVSSKKQVPALIIFPFVQALIKRWIRHCESLEVRLTTLQPRHKKDPQLAAALKHVGDVLECKPVPLLFRIGDAAVEPLGTKAVLDALPAEWKLAEDAGRHWLFVTLGENGLSDVERQYVIQHIVPGSELLSSDSTRNPIELRARAAAAHQRAVMQMRICIVKGFKS